MDIFFQDPSDVPLPPDEVRIRELRAEPRPDGRRVRVFLELTPFLKRPNGEVRITNRAGQEVASVSIIETMVHKLELTLHLRGPQPGGDYELAAEIFYQSIPEAAGNGETPLLEELPRQVVDRRSLVVAVPAAAA